MKQKHTSPYPQNPFPSTMSDPLSKMKATQQRATQLQQKYQLVIQRIGSSDVISIQLEEECNNLMNDIKAILYTIKELSLVIQVAFYDRNVYNQLTDDQLFQIDEFVTAQQPAFANLQTGLVQALKHKQQMLEQRKFNRNSSAIAFETTNNFIKNNDNTMDKWTRDVRNGVNDIKAQMQKMNVLVNEGAGDLDILGNGVRENKNQAKEAVGRVDMAIKTMRKNKDCCFFFLSLMCTISLILTFIFG